MKKKILALLLAACMAASLPAPARAETELPEADAVSEVNAAEEALPSEADAVEDVPMAEADVEEGISVSETEQTEDVVIEDEEPPIEEEAGQLPGEAERITGFALPGRSVITEQRKPALCEVQKLFPEEIGVYIGGTPSADPAAVPEGAELRTVPVVWECLQDYDEWLSEYEFVPAAEGLELGAGPERPVMVLAVEDLSTPVGGHIPSGEEEIPFVDSADLRRSAGSYYNGYELGNLPPVRNQGSYGTCWAFTALGAMETDLIADGTASPDSIDLSELHLIYFTYHPYTDPKGLNAGDSVSAPNYLQRGGNYKYAYRTLANMVGPTDEANAPYGSAASYAPDGTEAKAMDTVQLTDVSLINPDDRDAVKTAILQHGSVGASMYNDTRCYSATNNSYFYSGDAAPNHDILLAGWDDEFPAENFPGTPPAEDGAWLVRNSWGGKGYGYSGYFWISYEDKGIHGDAFAAYDADYALFDHVYAADTAVGCGGYSYSLSEDTRIIQRVSVDAGEAVEAVGMELDAGSSVTVTVSDGKRTASGSVSDTRRGYCLIQLDEPLPVARKRELTVTVAYNAAGRLYFEKPGSRSVFTASCGSGGFVIRNPSGSEQTVEGDASIKLYSIDCVIPPDPVEEFVERAYRLILEREAEEGGLDYWTDRLKAGEISGAELVNGFLVSDEFQEKQKSDEEVVTILYRTMLNREPDGGGKTYWLSFLEIGMSRGYVVKGFSSSQEFVGICAAYGIQAGTIELTEPRDQNPPVTAFVNRNYLYALLRRGEPLGLNDWTGALLNKTKTPQQVAGEFVFSPECVGRGLSDRAFIEMLYHLYMDREADEGGLNYWVTALEAGMPREQAVEGFAQSEEFQNILKSYGLLEETDAGGKGGSGHAG